jgi:predicted permease
LRDRCRFDVVTAIRALVATPVTTAATVLLLAVAVGLNLAMLGLIDRAILSPARLVPDPAGIFTLAFDVPTARGAPGRMTTTSFVAFETVRDQVPACSGVAAWRRASTSAIIMGEQVRTEAMLVTESYFAVLGVTPRLGRGLTPDSARGSTDVPSAVLSHTFWRSAFAGDPSVPGRRFTLRGVEYAVSGVMPPGFSGHSAARVDVWLPFATAMRDVPDWQTNPMRNVVSIVVRIAAGSDASAAAAQAGTALGRRVALTDLRGGEIAPTEQRIAYALAGVSVLVLIIGLANSTTLLLARGRRRRREAAIRAALGASRGRLLTHVLLEAAMLAALATGGALALAYWFDEAVRRLLLASVIENPGPTPRLLLAVALAGVGAFGLAASVGFVQLPRQVRAGDMTDAGRGRPRRKTYAALLLVQTTLSVVLLAGTGMFGRSLFNLVAQDFGMRLDNVLLVGFERGPGSMAVQRQVFESGVERVRSLPGVELATIVQMLPFTGFHVLPVGVPGHAESPNVDGQLPYLLAATPELFEILGVEIIQGRRFNAADDRGAPVVIVNEMMARTIWPGETSLGKCIRIGFDPSFDPFTATGPPGPPVSVPCREIVGVTRNMRQRSVVPTGSEDRLMQYFVPFSQVPGPPGAPGMGPGIQGLLVRTSREPVDLVAPVRRAILDGRSDLPFLEVRPYMQLLQDQMRPWRLGTLLLALFCTLALGVAAMGLYAAFAHTVAERHREMAIRIAIGARPRAVLLMVLGDAGRLAVAGTVCGSVLALLTGRTVQSMLVGTAPSDPIVLSLTAVVMMAVAIAATWLPARAAAQADPTALLRAE